jgi:hypothetical protein
MRPFASGLLMATFAGAQSEQSIPRCYLLANRVNRSGMAWPPLTAHVVAFRRQLDVIV